MKGQCLKPDKKPDAVPLDFFSCLYHTGFINRQEAEGTHGYKTCRGTPAKIYTESSRGDDRKTGAKHSGDDLLDIHFFLTEDDDLDDDEFEEDFYIDLF